MISVGQFFKIKEGDYLNLEDVARCTFHEKGGATQEGHLRIYGKGTDGSSYPAIEIYGPEAAQVYERFKYAAKIEMSKPCLDCGQKGWPFIILDNEKWLVIAEKRDWLCPLCMDKRFLTKFGRKMDFFDLKPCGITSLLKWGRELIDRAERRAKKKVTLHDTEEYEQDEE